MADALGGGLWPGLHVLAGEGDRSSWAVEAVVHAASDGVPVLYLSPELDSLGLHCRALSTLARLRCSADVAWSDAYVGRNRFPDGVAEALEAMPIYFPELDAVGFTGAAILGAVNAFRELHPRAEHPRALVVVDSLQMVASPDGVREEARERVGRAAATCLTAARRHEAAVLALSSVSRRGADDAREAPVASMWLCMAVVGGAIVPVATGALADIVTLLPALILPAACYALIARFALLCARTLENPA
ncbi:DnaB-like helicase C-terminal domain-containing protein [uncultured Caulobacter sp.]|uniref:DnaB-like helicase C-terminal domain-containing protein n=1 Tax=uncultured Caulobacter sp. TaxID=158749 RepID=UPI002621509F|nr:DnaB-like helicase C-terminal domain-containing protein [uncultured Caulobacter sp.]